MPVFLMTNRLVLRGFVASDVEHLLELHNDPDVMRFIDGGRGRSRADVEREHRGTFAREGYWAAAKETGEFLGWFGLHPAEGCDPGNVELGYRLERSAWRRGYAIEGCRALIHEGFTELGVRRVWAQTMAVNLASRRVMEGAGLTYVRTFHPEWADPLPGSEGGEVEYSLTVQGWERRRAAT